MDVAYSLYVFLGMIYTDTLQNAVTCQLQELSADGIGYVGPHLIVQGVITIVENELLLDKTT